MSKVSNKILPLELIDKAIGSKIWILMKNPNDPNIVGTLQGFDDFVNLVLTDATEYFVDKKIKREIGEILLNGNHIALMIPGGAGPAGF